MSEFAHSGIFQVFIVILVEETKMQVFTMFGVLQEV